MNYYNIALAYLKRWLYDQIYLPYGVYRYIKVLFKSAVAAIINSSIIRDAAHVVQSLLWIGILIFVVALIKSLQPRYILRNDFPRRDDSELDEVSSIHHSRYHPPIPNEDLAGRKTDRNLRNNKSKRSARGLESNIEEYYLENIIYSDETAEPIPMTVSDTQQIYEQLPWLQTQVEFEGCDWINRTLLEFWPSAKYLLNKYVISKLSKRRYDVPQESRDLAKKKTKLSIFLSCRRKIEMLRRARAEFSQSNRFTKGLFKRSAMALMGIIMQIFTVYLKQFITDYLFQLIKRLVDHPKRKDTMLASNQAAQMTCGLELQRRPRSWAGFDSKRISTRRGTKSAGPWSLSISRKHSPRVPYQPMAGLSNLKRMRGKRIELARKIMRAHNDQLKPPIQIRRFELGDTTPIIEGVRYIDETSSAYIESVKVGKHLLTSDECNMRLVAEISYRTDYKFAIVFKSIPVLNRIKLSKIDVKLRFMITINHSRLAPNNSNLEIFDTPGNALIPAINGLQLTLLDVPQIDWRVRGGLKKPKFADLRAQSALRSIINKTHLYLLRVLDPFRLVNHIYFKYMVHCLMCFVLRWFQPFDIKLDDRFYINAACFR